MKKPYWSVTKVIPFEDHSIYLEFEDGRAGLYDAAPLLSVPMFDNLKDIGFFMKAHNEFNTVVWDEDIDIAPETLYKDSKTVLKRSI